MGKLNSLMFCYLVGLTVVFDILKSIGTIGLKQGTVRFPYQSGGGQHTLLGFQQIYRLQHNLELRNSTRMVLCVLCILP